MGLYNKSNRYQLVFEDVWLSGWNLPFEYLPEKSHVVLDGVGEFDIDCQLRSRRIPMAGEYSIAWLGNSNLLPKEFENPLSHEFNEKRYPDVPFVIWVNSGDLHDFGNGCILAEGIELERYAELKIYDTSSSIVVYEPIPEEYIPDTIARKSDISGAGGSGGGLHVTISYDQGAGEYSTSHTIEEIYEAAKTGPVTGTYISNGSETMKMLTLSNVRLSPYDDYEDQATFFCPDIRRNSTDFARCVAYIIDVDGNVTEKYLYTTAE